ncbi:hypothetical protein [Hymenobacter cheonanensis]|uniref:hypothetical protein n=1 Tax=Hymenobacter sp. CA2-7 TaxID=3063993 RepID=UPI0027141CDB|nr:hypothetical protein [Hymenobacter sp. CA2-7]MDO7888249.1 hypothetical protein [Hymenobacter sp. CA2-7]
MALCLVASPAPLVLAYLYWPAAVVLMAAGQGLLLPAVRRTPPGAEARRQSFALHGLLTAVYFLPVVLVLCLAPHDSIRHGIIAVLARLLLFDPVLNLAASDRPFAVGQTAASDRALQWLAQRVGWPADRVRAVVWVLSVGVAGYLVIKLKLLV